MANEEQTELEASLEPSDLEKLSAQLKGVLDIQDRRYGFPPQTYEECFGCGSFRANHYPLLTIG